MVTAFVVSELLRENQQGGGWIKLHLEWKIFNFSIKRLRGNNKTTPSRINVKQTECMLLSCQVRVSD